MNFSSVLFCQVHCLHNESFILGIWHVFHLKSRSHDLPVRIRFLLVPKIGSCEHIENDFPTHRSVILKKRMEIEHVLFSSDTFLER